MSVLACGFKSHFPHQCKGHSIFECPLFLYLGKSANYYHQKQSRWNRTKSLISWKRNLFRRLTKASLRCPSQYWRVGSSPISRTIKETSFVYHDKRGFFLLSGQNKGRIIEKRASERSIDRYGARFLRSAAKGYRNRCCTNRISLLCKQLLNVFRR